MDCIPLNGNERFRGQLREFLMREWGDTKIVVRGEWYDLDLCGTFLCVDGETAVGAVHYVFTGDGCEILSLFSLWEHIGVGRALMGQVAQECRGHGVRMLRVVTTNDNTRAIRFYQQYGMVLTAVRLNQVDNVSRKMKPSIPFAGCDGIPIRHELELTLRL